MAVQLSYSWREPAPRTQKERERLAVLERMAQMAGEDTPIFRRAEVMELAGMDDSDWRWAMYNRLVTGTRDRERGFAKFSVREVRALRMAMRLKKKGLRNHLIKLEIDHFLGRVPRQATLDRNVMDYLAQRA